MDRYFLCIKDTSITFPDDKFVVGKVYKFVKHPEFTNSLYCEAFSHIKENCSPPETSHGESYINKYFKEVTKKITTKLGKILYAV